MPTLRLRGAPAVPPPSRRRECRRVIAVAAVFLLALAVRPCPAQVALFSDAPAWRSTVSDNTMSVAWGDVDLDGDLDLVMANTSGMGERLGLYRNEGGALESGPSWQSGVLEPSMAVALGDVDGDGDLDLATARLDGNSLYLNEGGSFAALPAWSSTWANEAAGVALGDVDGDGDLDLVSGNRFNTPTALFLNDGGSFSDTPDWTSSVQELTNDVVLGDVDGDGRLDLVCGNGVFEDRPNSLYLNRGGTFGDTPDWTGGEAHRTFDVALGDVDGDGDLDLLCGHDGSGTTLYVNDGGGFGSLPAWRSDLAAGTLDLGDVDGDGDLDLACGVHGGSCSLHLNHGTGYPAVPDWQSVAATNTVHVALGDVDGDGALDLACGNGDAPNCLFDNLSCRLAASPSWTSDPGPRIAAVAVADVDGDGWPDAVLARPGAGGSVAVHLNAQGRLGAVPDWIAPFAAATAALALGDVDGDGRPDLVAGNQGEPDALHLNTGAGFAASPTWQSATAATTQGLVLGDVDGDGDPDLVCVHRDESNALYLNEGGTFAASPAWISGADPYTACVALGDVDGDGAPDVVFGNGGGASDEPNTMYLNRGGLFSAEPDWTSTARHMTAAIALADVDGDGAPDLVCGNGIRINTVYLNRDGGFSPQPDWSTGSPQGTVALDVADLDGDGRADLVCGNVAVFGAPCTVFMNEGGVLPAEPSGRLDPVEETAAVVLADLDRDGDTDLLTCDYAMETGSTVLVHDGPKNPAFAGDPLTPTAHLPNNPAGLRRVRVAAEADNLYRVGFELADPESDRVWIVPEYQFLGEPVWRPADLGAGSSALGPLAAPAGGAAHEFLWDVFLEPFDPRPAVLRLRAVSFPDRAGRMRRVDASHHDVGVLNVHRPVIAADPEPLAFVTVTVGDTVSLDLTIANAGNEELVVQDIALPSAEMTHAAATPFALAGGQSAPVAITLGPRTVLEVPGAVQIASNDPLAPVKAVAVQTDIRPLAFRSRLLAPAPQAPLGEALTVVVTPAPEVRVERGWLFHRPGGSAAAFADSIPLVASGEEFIAVIPGAAVAERGLEYWIRVENSGLQAVDPPGAPADSLYFQAVASPTQISSQPQPNAGSGFAAGRDIAVQIFLPVGTTLQSGTLHHRAGGETDWTAQPVTDEGLFAQATIPAAGAGARGVEYWVSLQTATSELSDPQVGPAAEPLAIRLTVTDLTEPDSHPARHYRMVSVPLDFGADFTGDLESLLADQDAFGPYDPVHWRCYRYLPAQDAYVEYAEGTADAFRPEPGRAFWLICADEHRIGTAPVPGTSTPTDGPCEIVLQPGWNQVGDPFLFPVAWDSLCVDGTATGEAGDLVEPPLRYEAGTGYVADVARLEPWRGYWIHNISVPPRELILAVPPREVPATAKTPDAPDGWRLAVAASCGAAADRGALLGCAADGAEAWDPRDRAEPPSCPGDAVTVYFPHGDWTLRPGRYDRDVRPPLPAGEEADGRCWRLDVARSFAREGATEEVLLEFAGLETVPDGVGLVLVDRELARTVDLREACSYRFHLGRREPVARETAARFALLAGGAGYVGEEARRLLELPSRTALHQNRPNPFNPATVIRFDVARPGRAALRVYNLAGALVRTLYAGPVEPGGYEFAWRGEDDRGRRTASGVYVYRLETSWGHRETRKLTLLQ